MEEKELQQQIIKELDIEDITTVDLAGYINVEGDVDIRKSITIKKGGHIPVKFGEVKGNFICSYCLLTTLWGCPKYVGGKFDCTSNKITSLKGGPEIVDGDYKANGCKELISWTGAPEKVGGKFESINGQVYSAEGLNQTKFAGDVVLDNNKLRGISNLFLNVEGRISITHNLITHLDKEVQDSDKVEYSDNPISQTDIETDHFW